MKRLSRLLLLMLLMETSVIAADSPIAGTWRGKLHDLPAMVLTVKEGGEKVSGTMLLYFLHRDTEHDAWQVDTKRTVLLPLLKPELKPVAHPFYGKVGLFFQVSHSEALPPSTLCGQRVVAFFLIPREKDQADLVNTCFEGPGPALKMVRDGK